MLVGINEAARRANVPKSTIDRNIARGTLSCTQGADGRRLLDTAELDRWAQSRPAPKRMAQAPGGVPALMAECDYLRAEVARLRAELERERDERRELERQGRSERDRLLTMVEGVTHRLLAAPATLAESILPSWLTGRS